MRVQVDANLALVGFDAEKDFDAIVSADLFERLKPAPDIFLAAAKQVPPSSRRCRARQNGPVSHEPSLENAEGSFHAWHLQQHQHHCRLACPALIPAKSGR